MKNKKEVKKKLIQDLLKYSEQIGLEYAPRIVFDVKEWREIGCKKIKRQKQLGRASYQHNVVLVNLDYQGNGAGHNIYHKKTHRRIGWTVGKMNLREARHTLVHELVHMRFRKLWHGYYFEKRIDEILAGQRFEKKE